MCEFDRSVHFTCYLRPGIIAPGQKAVFPEKNFFKVTEAHPSLKYKIFM